MAQVVGVGQSRQFPMQLVCAPTRIEWPTQAKAASRNTVSWFLLNIGVKLIDLCTGFLKIDLCTGFVIIDLKLIINY